MPTQNALAERQAARFATDLTALAGGMTSNRFGLAVSGGADSIAMLLLAQAALPDRIAAATVDHGLRAESNVEAHFVAALCAERGIDHRILTIEVLAPGNVSDAARQARYGALFTWMKADNIDWLLTAHHADDQLETMMMRLNRSSGASGLAGIRRRQGRIVRPLLKWRREDLAAIVAAAGIVPVDDPSNRDDRYDRARMRKALAGADWIDPVAVAESADALADADAALEWTVARLRGERLTRSGAFWVCDAHDLPRELKRRVLIDCLRAIDENLHPRGDAIERVLAALAVRRTVTIGQVRCESAQDGGVWTFAIAPPRRTK